jgi:hypothetical protein
MENLKYWIFGLGLILISFGWFFKAEDVKYYKIEKTLNNVESVKYIKQYRKSAHYYKEVKYRIVKKRGVIPFTYKEIDTIKKPEVTFYSTQYPENHNENPNDNSCGCN